MFASSSESLGHYGQMLSEQDTAGPDPEPSSACFYLTFGETSRVYDLCNLSTR